MKNSKWFGSDREEQAGPVDERVLEQLGRDLRACPCRPERTEQHQEWAWTRLERELAATKPAPSYFAMAGWSSSLACALILAGALWMEYHPGSDADPMPTVTALDTHLSATPLRVDGADVIWVTGYDYIPTLPPIR
jgi:hypothetical protein